MRCRKLLLTGKLNLPAQNLLCLVREPNVVRAAVRTEQNARHHANSVRQYLAIHGLPKLELHYVFAHIVAPLRLDGGSSNSTFGKLTTRTGGDIATPTPPISMIAPLVESMSSIQPSGALSQSTKKFSTHSGFTPPKCSSRTLPFLAADAKNPARVILSFLCHFSRPWSKS